MALEVATKVEEEAKRRKTEAEETQKAAQTDFDALGLSSDWVDVLQKALLAEDAAANPRRRSAGKGAKLDTEAIIAYVRKNAGRDGVTAMAVARGVGAEKTAPVSAALGKLVERRELSTNGQSGRGKRYLPA